MDVRSPAKVQFGMVHQFDPPIAVTAAAPPVVP